MKTLQNNFTTPEQSKRLLELGVPADSADCVHTYLGIKILPEGIKYSNYDWMVADGDDRIPCWSDGRLMEIYEICNGKTFERNDVYNIFSDIFTTIESALLNHKMDFSKLEE